METRSDSEIFKAPERSTYSWKNIPMDDPRVWAMIGRGDCKGIFQIESPLGRQWCKKIKPSNIDDLAALVSLIRPGGLESGMCEKFAKIKNKEEELSYIHPSLEPILKDTHSVLTFQEQQLKICMDLAGFTEVEADSARKAIGKKLPEEMNKVHTKFIEGCEKKGIVSKEIATQIWSWIQASVRYLFNAGHSYSYSYISYFQAYQKYYFPTEFYTSALTFSDEKIDPKQEVYELVQDARLHGIKVIPPDICRKNAGFEIVKKGEIAFGLTSIRGVGSSAIKKINLLKLDSFQDVLFHVKDLKKNVIESLVKSGACDRFGINRSEMLRQIHVICGRGDKDTDNTKPEFKPLTIVELKHFLKRLPDIGIMASLQAIVDNEECISKRIPTLLSKIEFLKTPVSKESNRLRSIWEKHYLGLALTCSAADDVEKIDYSVKTCLQAIKSQDKEKLKLHCVLDKVDIRKTSEKAKNPGQEYANLLLSDSYGAINAVLWPNKYEEFKEDIIQDTVYFIEGRKDCWNGREQLVIDRLKILE